MVKFTDRKEELNLLRERYEKLEKGELIILYGRRRVGKTELIRKFLKGIPKESGAYVMVDERTPVDMLRSISEDIGTEWPEVKSEFQSWDSLFSFLGSRAEERKTVILIDEFQRMHSDPRAFARFQKAWDISLKDKPIMIVFLGSVIGTINKIAMNRKSPLFGRATSKISLQPFDYQAFRQALSRIKDEKLLVRLYTTFGGMPNYLNFAEECESMDRYIEIVEKTILKKNSTLREEPQTLLQMELKDTGRYNSILAAIAGGHRNGKEITDHTGINPASLNFYMDRLEKHLQIIEKTVPLCGKHKPQYVFRDNFFAFWHKFVFRNLSALEIENYELVKKSISNDINALEGKVFESIVKEIIIKHNRMGKAIKGAAMDFSEIGSWWGRKGEDIDILALGKKSILAGEVKWTNEPMDPSVLMELENRVKMISCSQEQRSDVKMLAVSKSGFTENAKKYMEERKIISLDLDEIANLFNGLPEK